MRWLIILAAGLTVAAVVLFATTAQAQEGVDLGIEELAGSGVTGSAFLMPASGGQTEVTVRLRGLDPGSSHVNHIHEGTGCASGEYSGIVEELANIDADSSGVGTATTTASIAFDMVPGEHVIVVHAGATLEEDATPIACGHIPIASIVSLPPTTGTGFSSGGGGTALAIALGATMAVGLSLLAGGWVLRRRQAVRLQ